LVLIGCKSGISKDAKKNIQFYIYLANQNKQLNFDIDSINEATAFKIKYIGLDSVNVQNALKAQMDVFSLNWNDPYDIKKVSFSYL
jgi:hypothetical protein